MNFNKKDLIFFIIFGIIFYKLFFKTEKFTVEGQLDAIKNLSILANNLTNGKLTVPGGLEITGDLKVNGNASFGHNNGRALYIQSSNLNSNSCTKLSFSDGNKTISQIIPTVDKGILISSDIKVLGKATINEQTTIKDSLVCDSNINVNSIYTNTLNVKGNSNFGTRSNKPLSIISSGLNANEITYISYGQAGKTISNINCDTNGNISIKKLNLNNLIISDDNEVKIKLESKNYGTNVIQTDTTNGGLYVHAQGTSLDGRPIKQWG